VRRAGLADGRGLGDPGLLEHELAVPHIHQNGVAVGELVVEEPHGEGVLDESLDRALQRTRPVGRIPSCLCEELLRRVRELDPNTPLGEALLQAVELEPDDLREMLA
jgi:hypothetical protein